MNANSTQRKRNHPWIRKTIPWAVTVIIIGGGATYWTMQNHAKAATTPAVRWMTAQKGNVQKTVSLSGTLNPANEVSLTGSGKITSISVKAGQKVQAGQVIAQLDSSSYEVQLQEAQANLKSAEAKLAQAEKPTTVQNGKFGTTTQNPDPNSVAQAQASVEQAQAQVTSMEQQANNVLMLPTAAITQQRGTAGVYISSSSSGSASSSNGNTSSSAPANSFNGQNIPSGLQF